MAVLPSSEMATDTPKLSYSRASDAWIFLLLGPSGPGPGENVGGTGVGEIIVAYSHTVSRRPHDGGITILRDGDGYAKIVIRLFIRRLDFRLLGPSGPGPGENVGGTGVSTTRILKMRPHDGGITIIGDGDGTTEKVTLLFVRRLDFLLLGPSGPGPREYVDRTGVVHGIGAYYRILIPRPHDGGITILRDGNGRAKIVVRLFIPTPGFSFVGVQVVPDRVKNVGGTGSVPPVSSYGRPHDGGVTITGDGNGLPEPVIRLFIRRQDLGFIE